MITPASPKTSPDANGRDDLAARNAALACKAFFCSTLRPSVAPALDRMPVPDLFGALVHWQRKRTERILRKQRSAGCVRVPNDRLKVILAFPETLMAKGRTICGRPSAETSVGTRRPHQAGLAVRGRACQRSLIWRMVRCSGRSTAT